MPRKRRVDLRGILAKPDLRRELMVSTLQATQAREGIDTTREQAERAYYVVTEGDVAACFDLVGFRPDGGTSTDSRELEFVKSLRGVNGNAVRFDVARSDFAVIEGAPLAYRNLALLGPLFRAHPRLGDAWADVQGGMNATESARFLRHHWEIAPATRRSWMTYSKGGSFSRFYSDILLVIDWTDDGRDYKAVVADKYGSASRFVKSEAYYGRPGLTWTEMTNKGLSVRRLPEGTIFNCKGPCAFASDIEVERFLLAIMNSSVAQALLSCLTSRSYGSTYVAQLPIPSVAPATMAQLGALAERSYAIKAAWDAGNEISTRFVIPWALQAEFAGDGPISKRLSRVARTEREKERDIRTIYSEIDDRAFRIYGVPDTRRAAILESLGDRRRAGRPATTETLWPQMEGKTAEQKRMEHVFRLLSYVVKCVVDADEDGIVPFMPAAGEPGLAERVHRELQALFPKLDIGQVEVEITNELKKKVKGYRRTDGIAEWLENAFFEYHCSLYKKRPVLWHIASSQGTAPFAFGALVHYHRFDRNRMAQLRAQYLRDAIETFRREAALADRAGRTDARLEWQARLEEAQELDRRLQWVQEGHHEGPDGGDRDYRILTPWKSPEERPKGWDPDLDDGVKVNIEPLQRAGVLRVGKVV